MRLKRWFIFFTVLGFGGTVWAESPTPRTMCQTTIGSTGAEVPAPPVTTILTDHQIENIKTLTTIFENSTTKKAYGYIENLKDGRGYTAGIVGFCSGTGDMLQVITRYLFLKPTENALARYLPTLKKVNNTGHTEGLGEKFIRDWKQSAQDPLFRRSQDDVENALYFCPALRHADQLKLKTPVAIGQIYDAIIQHGDGSDLDGLPKLIERASKRTKLSDPKNGADETAWLKNFLDERKKDLENPANGPSTAAWRESADRVTAYRALLETTPDLVGPFNVSVFKSSYSIAGPSSGTSSGMH